MKNFTDSLRDYKTCFLVTIFLVVSFLATGCGESFLEPDPKSFLSPENTFTTKAGLEGVAVNANRQLRVQWSHANGVNSPIITEYFYADIAVNGNPDTRYRHNMSTQIIPAGSGPESVLDSWNVAYDGIKYANIIVSHIDNVEDWSSEEEKNEILAAGYFHRSYWYYRLTHLFGDVPVYLDAIEQPRLDFNTYSREAILKKMRDDMEFAVQWLPQNTRPGEVNRASGYYLLTKIYLSLRQFQDAVNAASQVIDGGNYALMTDRFGQGPYADDPRFNVMWDLHQKENKSSSDNTEAILVLQDKYGIEGSDIRTELIYTASPMWHWSAVQDPNGVHATTDGPEGNPFSDSLGRGVGQVRTTSYFNYALWKDPNDLRHSDVNWFSKDEFYYNNPSSDYYGEPFVAEYIGDTTRTWYPFPYNKVYVPDEEREVRKRGGHTDLYLYRLAGLHLLRAEAYYWMENMGQAAADINVVRERVQAQPISPSEVSIDYIFDERARELYLEEPRKTELTRVAYIMAQLGREGYSLPDMYENNWFYDRVMRANVYYREQLQYGPNPYVMEPYHVYWPVPQDEIDSNVQGEINQAPGYNGWENNTEPLGYEAIQELANGKDAS